MKAIILAAGMASRMRPLTIDTPKCLLNLGPQNILQRTLNNLISCNITEIVIVTGFMQHKIKAFVESHFPNTNIYFIHNELYESTNNIYSLWLTKKHVLNEDILLLDSDIVFDQKILELLLFSSHENCLALKPGFDLGEEEIKIKINNDNSLSEIGKKINPAEAAGESIGIEKFSGQAVNNLFQILDTMILTEKNVNIFYEAAFQKAIDRGLKIIPVDVGRLSCMEIDTIEDLEFAREKIIPSLDKKQKHSQF